MKKREGKSWAGLLLLTLVLLSPAASRAQQCVGDCDGDNAVTVDEIVTIVNIALGNRPLADCPAGDRTDDGVITVDEIVIALNFALDGCPPTPTATPDIETVRVDVGTTSGARGTIVNVAVTLSQSMGVIAATSNDIIYDNSQVRPVESAPASCTINPAIGPGSAADKMLISAVAVISGATERLRVGIIGFNSTTIPDGLVFTCAFEILPTASLGIKVLDNTPDASLPNGDPPPAVAGADGAIAVTP